VGLPSADVLQTAPKVRLLVAERGATFVTQSATMEGEKYLLPTMLRLTRT